MKKIFSALLICTGLHAAGQNTHENLVQYVKPIIGTQRMGHTYPGATVPFGMVQLSPETDTASYELNGKYNPKVYEYCAGYQYEDKTIVGFSHTHFSGTGHSDLGDFLIMPTVGTLKLNPGVADKPGSGYRSAFSHANEVSAANYYKVKLDASNITAEMTTSTRVGFHQYTFPKSDQSHIILDLMAGIYNYPDKTVWTYVKILNDSTLVGYRQTNGWARTRNLYFAMAFNKKFIQHGFKKYDKREVYGGFWGKFNQSKNFPEIAGKQIRAYFDFKTEEGEKIKVKFALSSVSMDGAMANMQAEVPGWDFDKVKNDGQAQWEKELEKITVNASVERKQDFYTAMYHTMINPTIYMDVDGQYKGLDQNIHKADGFINYTTFSLWDTYRALHPLFNIIQPQRNADMVKSMMVHFDQSPEGMLPVWSNSANENWCMSGYHSVSVIADAVVKGNAPFDAEKALTACVATARHRSYEGIGEYMDKGYIPDEKTGVSVSNTLEYAYDDWAIAQMAKKLGKTDIYNEFIKRSENYKNVYDSKSGFMRPRLADGTFRAKFDPLSTINEGFIEGNAWNYTLFAPQDPAGLIKLMGGNKRFVPYLDSLFTMNLPDKYFAETEDITRDGIIGNYVHGNEPSHHVAYLYNWTNQPWKTQERIRMILPRMYKPTPDGLGGNDDTGQMSAWYIFSSMGFYPVAPGSVDYSIGSPSVNNATIQVGNGKTFNIIVKNQNEKNVYVQKMTLNGKSYTALTLTHQDIMNGGEMVFYMSAKHK
ncbi:MULTISPECIES: GH92 family glycosyl hydrolase [unclassified Mucilaginibacter]|uniref:GH92 family glycosyl hydrolase n=1 Tax=unclassified Mucilaginibacter TaxID=2617802 RepID=UPI002AC9730E|nr:MULTISPECIES: GH92 family glycosyl hydrolase [unclassified Mucilaginibacter]MEB0262140.1 GH92 family glycosyl hydrolase [Mucilaginibacter sp. 10I4]MEB0279801.1 GH92 family glycosyl hydrolase [Mucilaginibacter sp. 10B2]MEB0301247.1 GH92 family glycosyl hydrolase [Mucilaginibacter sp. 5C4]WPX24227.1 GH92 family glycosyl hydrolase [Mucilaginibacter sp. 5C4]